MKTQEKPCTVNTGCHPMVNDPYCLRVPLHLILHCRSTIGCRSESLQKGLMSPKGCRPVACGEIKQGREEKTIACLFPHAMCLGNKPVYLWCPVIQVICGIHAERNSTTLQYSTHREFQRASNSPEQPLPVEGERTKETGRDDNLDKGKALRPKSLLCSPANAKSAALNADIATHKIRRGI